MWIERGGLSQVRNKRHGVQAKVRRKVQAEVRRKEVGLSVGGYVVWYGGSAYIPETRWS